MNTREKSLALAELMGWTTHIMGGDLDAVYVPIMGNETLTPYSDDCTAGLAQFAAILLKFPEVMLRFVDYTCSDQQGGYMTDVELVMMSEDEGWTKEGVEAHCPTQENILNEILKMKAAEKLRGGR